MISKERKEYADMLRWRSLLRHDPHPFLISDEELVELRVINAQYTRRPNALQCQVINFIDYDANRRDEQTSIQDTLYRYPVRVYDLLDSMDYCY